MQEYNISVNATRIKEEELEDGRRRQLKDLMKGKNPLICNCTMVWTKQLSWNHSKIDCETPKFEHNKEQIINIHDFAANFGDKCEDSPPNKIYHKCGNYLYYCSYESEQPCKVKCGARKPDHTPVLYWIDLKTIEKNLDKALDTLIIWHYYETWFPYKFLAGKSITYLEIRNSKIEELWEDDILADVKHFALYYNNHLSVIQPLALKNLRFLLKLTIKSAPALTRLDLNLEHPSQIMTIEIMDTGLQQMAQPQMPKRNKILQLTLENNALICNCSMVWLLRCENQTYVRPVMVECDEPQKTHTPNKPMKVADFGCSSSDDKCYQYP